MCVLLACATLTRGASAFAAEPAPAPAPAPALAAPAPAAAPSQDAKTRQRANDLVKQARAAFDAGSFSESGRLYLLALELAEAVGLGSKPELLFNAGLSFERTGDCERAADLYDRYLTQRPDAGADPELLSRIERQRSCAPELVVVTTPPGAVVSVDGKALGLSPLRAHVKKGAHALRITLLSHRVVEKAIDVEAALAIEERLEALAGEGRLALHAIGEGDVALDGKFAGKGPFDVTFTLTAGPHQIRVSRPLCKPAEFNADIEAGREAQPMVVKASCGAEVEVVLDLPNDAKLSIDGDPYAGPWGLRSLPSGTHHLHIESPTCGVADEEVSVTENRPPIRVASCPSVTTAPRPSPWFWVSGGVGLAGGAGGAALLAASAGAAAGSQGNLRAAAGVSLGAGALGLIGAIVLYALSD
jgi:hypothetical protein